MRESLNIFLFISYHDYKRVSELLKILFFLENEWKLVLKDSWFGLFEITYCKVFGHVNNYNDVGTLEQESDIFCKNCKTYIKTLSYKEHKNIIRKNIIRKIK